MRLSEVRVDLDWTVLKLKQYLEGKVGTSVNDMMLVMQDINSNSICTLSENDRSLSFYNFQDQYNIHVIDLDPNSVLKGFDDLDSV
jgi:hypothetical protein